VRDDCHRYLRVFDRTSQIQRERILRAVSRSSNGSSSSRTADGEQRHAPVRAAEARADKVAAPGRPGARFQTAGEPHPHARSPRLWTGAVPRARRARCARPTGKGNRPLKHHRHGPQRPALSAPTGRSRLQACEAGCFSPPVRAEDHKRLTRAEGDLVDGELEDAAA